MFSALSRGLSLGSLLPGLPNLRLSLLLPSLFLILPDLGPLPVLLPSLISQLLSLLLWRGLIVLDTPRLSPVPVPVIAPSLPVPLKPVIGKPFIVPLAPAPAMIFMVRPPPRVYIIVKTRNVAVISPPTVIIARTIPTAVPWTPPPAIPEKQVYIYAGNDVNVVRIRQHDYLRRSREHDGRRKADTDAYTRLRHGWNRSGSHQHQKYYSKK
jgi:hypothetical protein